MNKQDKMSLREIQLGSLEVLKKIKRICDDNNYRYFLAYGSLIGAIRNKGIIPWDDDIDIMMPREDYNKLKKYFKENESKLFPLKAFDNEIMKEYPHSIMRISNQEYKLEFDNEKDYGIGLFIDVYPIDGIGNDKEEAKKLLHKAKRTASLCFLTSRKGFGVDNTKSKVKMIIKFPAYIWANILGNEHYQKKTRKLCNRYSYNNSKYIACIAQPNDGNDIFEKETFEPIETNFEGVKVTIPKGYDIFLKNIYGDYMTPPDEQGRKTHHTYDAYKK